MDLTAAAALYGTTTDSLRKLGAFESDVYEFDGPHGPGILKVIDPSHRTVQQVAGEVEWLRALHEAGVAVAEPLRAESGEWVERAGAPERVLVAFRRAEGELVKAADWTDARVQAWGRLLGQLQAHSRTFAPAGPRRGALRQHSYLFRAAEAVPEDPEFVRAAQELAAEAAYLLDHGAGAGLVHADLHHGNVLLHEERWTAIDFDDCGYGSYAFDLAMPIYYALTAQEDGEAMAERFVPPFLRGFREHAPDPLGGAEAVALALRVRDCELVMALRIKVTPARFSERHRRMEERLRANVKARRPVLPVETLRRWLD